MITLNPMTDIHIGDVHMDAAVAVARRPVIQVQQGRKPKNLVFDVYYNGTPWKPGDNGAHPLTHFRKADTESCGRFWDAWKDSQGNTGDTWEMDGSTIKLLLNESLTQEPGTFVVSVAFMDDKFNYFPQTLCILQVNAAPFLPKPRMQTTLELKTTEVTDPASGLTARAHLIDPQTGEAVDKITFDKPGYC